MTDEARSEEQQPSGAPPPSRLMLYGLAGVAGFSGGLAIGMVNYGFGVFVNGIAETQPTWSRTQISGALSVMSVCAGLVSPVIGHFLDKFGVRFIITGSMLVQALGFLILSRMKALEWLYVSYVLIGAGHSGTSYLGVGKVVGELFPGKNKGRVMGFVTSFNNICGLVFVQIHTWISQHYGWEVAAATFAVIFLILATIYFTVMSLFYAKTVRALNDTKVDTQPLPSEARPVPVEESEDNPDALHTEGGDGDADEEARPPTTEGTQRPEENVGKVVHKSNVVLRAVLSPVFIFTALGLMCAEYTYNGVLSQIVPALVAEGFEDETAAHVISVLAAMGIVAKLFCGVLSERISARRALELCMVVESVALIIFAVTAPNPTAAWMAFAVYGSSFGGLGALRPLVVLETFGNGFFGRIYGILVLLFLIPALSAPIVAGYSYDKTGSYVLAFIGASGVFLVGAALLEVGLLYLRKQANADLPPYASCLTSYRQV